MGGIMSPAQNHPYEEWLEGIQGAQNMSAFDDVMREIEELQEGGRLVLTEDNKDFLQKIGVAAVLKVIGYYHSSETEADFETHETLEWTFNIISHLKIRPSVIRAVYNDETVEAIFRRPYDDGCSLIGILAAHYGSSVSEAEKREMEEPINHLLELYIDSVRRCYLLPKFSEDFIEISAHNIRDFDAIMSPKNREAVAENILQLAARVREMTIAQIVFRMQDQSRFPELHLQGALREHFMTKQGQQDAAIDPFDIQQLIDKHGMDLVEYARADDRARIAQDFAFAYHYLRQYAGVQVFREEELSELLRAEGISPESMGDFSHLLESIDERPEGLS